MLRVVPVRSTFFTERLTTITFVDASTVNKHFLSRVQLCFDNANERGTAMLR